MVQDGWESYEKWLSNLAPLTQKKKGAHFRNFIGWLKQSGTDFANYTPDELVTYQRDSDNGTRYNILDDLVTPYLRSKEIRHSTKVSYYSTIRSFFARNRAELPKDPNLRLRGDKPKVKGALPPEDIRKVILSSNEAYQAIFLCMFQGALDLEGFVYWNENGWPTLKEQLDAKTTPIMIELPGRKSTRNIRPFYTFIGRDAIEALSNYVEHHRPESDKAIFVTKFGEPMGKNAVYQYWLRHLRKLGMVGPPVSLKDGGRRNRTGMNPHEMRDTFRSQWAKSGRSPDLAEFLLGHDIDPDHYNKCFQDERWARNEYLNASKYLDIMSSEKPYSLIDEDELEKLRRENEELRRKYDKLLDNRIREKEEIREWQDSIEKQLRELKEEKR